MRQILILNSLADQRFRPFLEKVFLSVEVGTVWEDYEDIRGKTSLEYFQIEVEASDAVFLVLSQGAKSSLGAGGLAPFEQGLAKVKDLYVLEHCEDLKRVSIHVPRFQHHLALYITNAWTDHVVKIAETFEGTQSAPALFPDTRLEPLTPAAVGPFFDEGTGMALFDHSTSRPVGGKTTCPHCAAAYILHTPADMKITRCPACGNFSEVKPTK
jgi:hypothetical protein